MKARWLLVVAILVLAAPVYATPVNFTISADDFGWLKINGTTVVYVDCHYCAASGLVNLPGGWYDIEIKFMNRWGSADLFFLEDYTLHGDSGIVPEEWMRSRDVAGSWIPGLRADYFALASLPPIGTPSAFDVARGAFLGTVYGEGPISHGWGPGYPYQYQDVVNTAPNTSWGPYIPNAGWDKFAEELSGQIYLPGPEPVPEPATLFLLGTGLVGLRAWRKRRG
jgi:hypothetical protein